MRLATVKATLSKLSFMMDLNNIFGIHETALQLRSERASILAANLANADTPGFKARDLDFRQALENASNALWAGPEVQLVSTHVGHFSDSALNAVTDGFLRYRNPQQPSLDGNTVESDIERGEFARNAVGYMASLRFASGKINKIIAALKGE